MHDTFNSLNGSEHVRTSETDVIIVGAGPAGLMAGQALARLGVKVRIVDHRQPGAQYGHADGLQPRSLEIWESYGLRSIFARRSNDVQAMISYEKDETGGRIVRSIPSNNVVVDSRYPYESSASTETIEGTLRDSMENAGVKVYQPVTPISIDVLDQDRNSTPELTHPVKVVLKHIPISGPLAPKTNGTVVNGNGTVASATKTEVVNAKYLIGADGAHSWVRRHLGIVMEGDQTEYVWGVTDVLADTDFPDLRFKCVIQSSQGAMLIIPREEDKLRIYVQLSPEESAKTSDGRLDKSRLNPEAVRASVFSRIHAGLLPYKIKFTQVLWYTIFSIPQKVATNYSFKDRIFIVGDACHTHSPKAGQGANASMGDSHNLAWKLAYVLRGWADPSLLQTYEAERRKYAEDLIAFDKQISHVLDGGAAIDYKRTLHERNMFGSGVGLCYQSTLTVLTLNQPMLHIKPGERLPWSPLIRLGDWQPKDLQDIAISDGLFKIVIFASDILVPEQKARLVNFSEELSCSLRPEMMHRMSCYTIITSPKEKTIWTDVPTLLQSWKRVFVSEEKTTTSCYTKYGIGPEGAVVLVRPDGYISMIVQLDGISAQKIAAFLYEL